MDAIGDRTAVRWLRDDEPGAPQTGDGKFSEWAEFLDVGDEAVLRAIGEFWASLIP